MSTISSPPSQQDLIVKLLEDYGVEVEPRVVTMLLELQHALVKRILQRAKETSGSGKELQEKDLKLAFAELPQIATPFVVRPSAGVTGGGAINSKPLPLPSQTPETKPKRDVIVLQSSRTDDVDMKPTTTESNNVQDDSTQDGEYRPVKRKRTPYIGGSGGEATSTSYKRPRVFDA